MVDHDVGNVDEEDNTKHPNSPLRLIIPTADLLAQFHVETNNQVMNSDLVEIVTEIIGVFLNNTIDNVDALNGLPQLDRMTDSRFATNDKFEEMVRKATINLGFGLHRRMKEYGVYYQGVFSYFYDEMIGSDLVLYNFPY